MSLCSHAVLFTVIAVSFMPAPSTAATMQTRPLELSEKEQELLWASACALLPQSIEARQQYGGTMNIDHASVLCGAHAEYQGQPISLSVGCSRPSGTTHWRCHRAIPTVDMQVSERHVRVRYSFATMRDVSNVIHYVFSRPSHGRISVEESWLGPEVTINGSYPEDGRYLVSLGKHILRIVRENSGEGGSFKIESIVVCELDVCSPLAG